MAIMDAKATFAYEKTVAGSANAVITGSTICPEGVITSGAIQVVDLGKAGDAVGQELTLKAYVGETALTGSSGATVQVVLQTGGDNAINSAGSAVDSNFHDLYSGPVVAVGSATTGKGAKLFECRVPGGAERYLRAGVRIGTAATTGSGTVNIFLTKDL